MLQQRSSHRAISGAPRAVVESILDIPVVVVTGELDAATVPLLELEIGELMRDLTSHVVVDLRRVAFLGAAGLHMLQRLDQFAARRGARVEISCPDRSRRSLFTMIGPADCVRVHRDLASALKHALRAPRPLANRMTG